MAKKGPSMKSFRRLFHRSEASLSQSPDRERHDGERKRFKFPTLKPKSRSGSGNLQEIEQENLQENQQVIRQVCTSDAESSNAAGDGESWGNDVASKNKRFSAYGTAPRAKDKDLSYSEMDLRKPKRFATFSFGFRKKKKKDEDVSKSTFGLHSGGIEERRESLDQMKLDQTNTKRFSMSEPELDTSGAFDIPSPPPVASNQSESYFTLTGQSQERLANGLEVHQEPRKAPIASIPEARLDEPLPSAAEENLPGDFNSEIPKTQLVLPASTSDRSGDFNSEIPKTHLVLPASTSDRPGDSNSEIPKTQLVLPASTSDRPGDFNSEIPKTQLVLPASTSDRPGDFKSEIPKTQLVLPASTSDRLPDVDVIQPKPTKPIRPADGTIPNGTSSPVYLLPKNNPPVTGSIPQTDKSTIVSPSATEASSTSAAPLSPEIVYGALYESLFPQNFTADVLSSLSKSSRIQTETVVVKTLDSGEAADVAPTSLQSDDTVDGLAKTSPIYSDVTHTATKKEIVMIKTFNERHSESILRSDESESTDGRAEEPVDARSPQILTEYRDAEIKKPVMVKTLSEIQSESNITESDQSKAERITGVQSFIECEKMSPTETRKAIMVKTVYGPEVEAVNIGSDDGMDHETKKQPIMIKTRSEIHTESSVILSPKVSSAQSDSAVSKIQPDLRESLRLEGADSLASKTLNESQTEAKVIDKSDSIVGSVKDNLEGFPSLNEEPPNVPRPETYSDQVTDSVDGFAAAGANSVPILNEEPRDELSPRALSSLQSEEKQMRETHFPSVTQNKVDRPDNIVTGTEQPDVLKVSSEEPSGHAAEFLSVSGRCDAISSSEADKTTVPSESGDGFPSDSSRIPPSERKSDLAADSSGPGNTVPPTPDCAVSLGTDARVTGCQRSEELEESVRLDAASSSSATGVKVHTEGSSEQPGLMDGVEGCTSPSYLSVGSEDGATLEVYYSASEGESGDELFEREDGVFRPAGRPGDKGGREEVMIDGGDMEEPQGSRPTPETELKWLVGGNLGRKDMIAVQIKEMEEGKEEEVPATPVQQVNALMECDSAPPGEGEEVKHAVSVETQGEGKRVPSPLGGHLHLGGNETEYIDEAREPVPPNAQTESSDGVSGGSSNIIVAAETTPADSPVAAGNVTPCQWAEPVARSPDALVEVSVAPSEGNADAPHPGPGPQAAVETPEPDLQEGSPTASRTLQSDEASLAKMNSGYSSLSTKLSSRSLSLPKEEEPKLRIHKVSLIKDETGSGGTESGGTESGGTESGGTESGGTGSGGTGSGGTESGGTESEYGSGYRWRNRFEGVTQFVPKKTENSALPDSLRTSESLSNNSSSSSSSYSSSSSSFTLPEATAHTHLLDVSSHSLSPSPAEHTPLSRTVVYLRRDAEAAEQPSNPWRRSLLPREEPDSPAQREGEAEQQREAESGWESQRLSSAPAGSSTDQEDPEEAAAFSGVFKATLVQLLPEPPAVPPSPDDDDSCSPSDMESLVDTLKSMGPSMRPRGSSLRPPVPALMSSLPPIVEDASSPIVDVPDSSGAAAPLANGQYTLPADLGLRRNTRDLRSPLELMKQGQDQQSGTRNLSLQLRTSTTNSVGATSSDSSPDEAKSPVLNENGVPPSPSSRLDNSVLFGSYRSSSIDQTSDNGKSHRSLFRTGSLPDVGPASSRMSSGPKELGEARAGPDPLGPRSERLSFLLNSVTSSTSSLPGSDDLNSRISRPPSLGVGSPPAANGPARTLATSASLDLPRLPAATDAPLSMFSVGSGTSVPPLLQRSFSSDGLAATQPPMFSSMLSQFQSPGQQFQSPGQQFQSPGQQFQSQGQQFQSQEPDRNIMSKYRAFPDAYLTKEKEHGKLNPRPGKMYIFDRPGMCGQRLEIRSDIVDATAWELQDTISIRVIRGGWVMYEKPNFKGEKVALDEGDIELTCPFSPPDETANGQKDGEQQQNGEISEDKPGRRFIIGSIRRAVRDYSVPDISLFPEENAEGKKVVFRDTSDDARIFGFPIKANSIVINAGLWLVYAQPFFQGVPRVLEVGGYPNPAAWGVEQPYVGSLHPLKVGEPRVENLSEPKMVIYEKPYFTGKSRTINATMRDFMTRMDRQQTAFMYSVGSLKVQGGIWVGYEKEGFRGHQYLLEEGEYHDWRIWGGCNAELRSIRVIRADLTEPLMVMFEQPEEDQEGLQEENTFEVTEAIPDVELFEYKTSTRSIHVLSGAWVAYSHVDFSGNQYILEKGFYNNCADWGSVDTRICSVQPILMAPGDTLKSKDEILLYSEPNFNGDCHIFTLNQEALPDKLVTKSCRVSRGSWVLYENNQFSGSMFVLSEGLYPNLTSMAVPPDCRVRSIKVVPMMFSVPSISLFGLEGLEGREITTESEILSMVEEGFNSHILSVRVNSGCWVVCEHSNYRGRQFLLEPIEITNWPKFSSLSGVGSMYPVRQKRHLFRVKNKESGNYLSIQGGVEEMKSGRVVAAPQVEPMSDVWFYQDGLLKNKLAVNMALQVMGNVEPGAKVVLWTETRQPVQNWTAQTLGLISSLTFPGFVLDVKGGKSYDKDHVVVMPENDERPSQQWKIELC